MRAGEPPRGATIAEAVAARPLAWGGGWALLLGAILLLGVQLEWPFLVMAVLLLLLIAPSAGATVIVLSGTPRDHLERRGSIFGHFFVRYLTLILAFFTWTGSIVIGATISTAMQLEAAGREDEVLNAGLLLIAALAPFVTVVLWAAFVIRCAWFLARIRGWRALPSRSEVPDTLLAAHPEFRRLVVALANPGLLLITGLIAGIGVLFAVEIQLELMT